MQSDPITLAKTIATLDHISGGRVTLGVGFGWNLDELADHKVPLARRRTMLREYLEAMRALWTEEEAEFDGEFVQFGPSWAWPEVDAEPYPRQVGAAGNEKNFKWIARSADGWITTPGEADIEGRCCCSSRSGPTPGARVTGDRRPRLQAGTRRSWRSGANSASRPSSTACRRHRRTCFGLPGEARRQSSASRPSPPDSGSLGGDWGSLGEGLGSLGGVGASG